MHSRERHTLVYPSYVFEPEDWLRFVYLIPFQKRWEKLGLTDDDLRALEIAIMTDPKRPKVIVGTGGLRKIRFGDGKSGKGKSGGQRIYYTYFQSYSIVFVTAVFGKSEVDDLSDAAKAVMAALIKEIESQLDSGKIT
jgi:mRNA-degrading endonuclease RelE of RelBE toxin-antitoxin system